MNRVRAWKEEQIRLVRAFRSFLSQPSQREIVWREIQMHEEEGLKIGIIDKEIPEFNKAVAKLANNGRSLEETIKLLLDSDGKK